MIKCNIDLFYYYNGNMRKQFLIKSPEGFQGEKKLRKNKNYFEGWYFKNTNNKMGISFIPGINISGEEKRAFIQIITDGSSYFVNYDISDFKFGDDPFYVKIGDNFFSKECIHIDIKDDEQNLVVYGDIKYSDYINIDTSILSPNIMGIFSYVPFMECNHAILCMKSRADGLMSINDKDFVFDDGIGYIEKDWGCSFPKTYVWIQGNIFRNLDGAFMLSIADIPFKVFQFTGVICSLIAYGREFRFATYNNTKIVKYDVADDGLSVILKKGRYSLYIDTKCREGLKLSAPVKGKMDKEILETISASIDVTLKENDKIIFSDTSDNCGLEIVLQ